ncbi:MAG: HlyD family efflux transporter periplasmic adaptor subunit [Peptococcaceae bacterium]|nr:HlyD family efflux transporter periplasmic adaptor subunit [Peptococcaceae bacterium]
MNNRQTSINRQGFAYRLKRTLGKLIVVLGVVVLLTIGIIWAQNLILARQVQTVTAQAGSLQVPVPIQAWAANTEQVISAPFAGSLTEIIGQGLRVAKEGSIAKLTTPGGEGQIIFAPVAGAVSYNVDGLEGILTPQHLAQWSLSKFNNLTAAPPPGNSLHSGEAVCKIVDNLEPTSLLFDLPQPGRTLAVGDRVALRLDDQVVRGRVSKIAAQGPQNGVVVVLDDFLEPSLDERRLALKLLENKPPQGEIIPVVALSGTQGNQGVFVLADGIVTWQPVQVLAKVASNACVSGLKAGAAVITTPTAVHSGEIVASNP